MVLLFFQHTFLPTSTWKQIFCTGVGCFWSGTFFLRWLRQLFTFGAFQRWTSWHLLILLNANNISLWKPQLPLGALGLDAFSHPWKFQVSYVFPPLALVPLVRSKFLAEHVRGQLRHLILVAPCWMEATWFPTVLNMLVDVPQWCPLLKDLIMDVLVGQALKGLQYLHLTLWLLSNMCCADRGFLPWSVRQWWGQLECLHQGSTSSAGRSGPGGVLDRVYQTMPSLPLNKQIFCYICFRWD